MHTKGEVLGFLSSPAHELLTAGSFSGRPVTDPCLSPSYPLSAFKLENPVVVVGLWISSTPGRFPGENVRGTQW